VLGLGLTEIWLDMAKLVAGGQSLPPHVIPFCCASAAIGAALPLLRFAAEHWAGCSQIRKSTASRQNGNDRHGDAMSTIYDSSLGDANDLDGGSSDSSGRVASVLRCWSCRLESALPSGIGIAVGAHRVQMLRQSRPCV
jgi:hypothetical protein